MKYYVKNISSMRNIILHQPLQPQECLDLEEVFKKLSEDIVRKNGKIMKAQFKPTEFNKFLEWVKELTIDTAKWELVVKGEVDKTPRQVRKPVKPDIQVEAIKQREIDYKLLNPQQIAWLPYDEDTKKILEVFSNKKVLKSAFKFVRYLPAQEKVRKLIEDRIAELGESRA